MLQLMGKEGWNYDLKKIYYFEVVDENELYVIVGKVFVIRIVLKVGCMMMMFIYLIIYVGILF